MKMPEQYKEIELSHKPHVVILGAGASKASELNGDLQYGSIPLMKDLADALELKHFVDREDYKKAKENFELFFDSITKKPKYKEIRELIEYRIYDYFNTFRIKEKVTLYDKLVLSLRAKDVIATFNWDPLLCYAYRRNGFLKTLPELLFLHGNVIFGYCEDDSVYGWKDDKCKKCGKPFKPSRLLYPVSHKNYSEDPIIEGQWKNLQFSIEDSFFISFFGYSAPFTDIDARQKIINHIRDNKLKQYLEVEIVDLNYENLGENNFKEMVDDTHFYGISDWKNMYSLKYSRFSCEALFEAVMMNKPLPEFNIPDADNLSELQGWYVEITDQFPQFLEEGYSKKLVKED